MKTDIILVDFENVQPSNLAQLRGRDFKIKVFLGAHQTKLPTDTVLGIHPLGPAASEYIRIEGSGHNALDFHIAYYIGRLSAEFSGAQFHVVSQDTGFDPLIKHLATQNIACQRLPSLQGIPALKTALPHALSALVAKVEANLARRGASKPTKPKTLTTSIKAILGADATDERVKGVIDQLIERGIVAISGGKVTYPSP